MPNGAMLRAGTVASRQRSTNWRTDCREAAINAMGERQPWTMAVSILVDFRLPVPKSTIRKWQWGYWPHKKYPDVDKLCREVFDAFTGILWSDDSQVIYATIAKSYAWDDKTGANVSVNFLVDEHLEFAGNQYRPLINVMETL